MSRLTNFKWWVFKNKKPLYVDGFGNVIAGNEDTLKKADGQPASLTKSPTGWRDTLVRYARNNRYMGLVRDYTPPVDFAMDGARIIRDELWRGNTETELKLGISKLDRTVYPPIYRPWYIGDIDLSKFKQTKDIVSVMVVDGGPGKYLKANENTAYEIALDEVDIYFDGIPFNNTLEYSIFSQAVTNPLPGTITKDIGMGEIAREGTSQGILLSDQEANESVVFPGQKYFIKSLNKNITAEIEGRLNFRVIGSIGLEITIEKTDSTGTTTQYEIVNGTYSDGDFRSELFTFSIPMAPGDTLGLRCTIDSAGSIAILENSRMGMAFEVTFTPSTVKGITAYTLFQRLVQQMTDDKYTGESTFLQELSGLIYTSGQGLRQFDDPKIKISLSDFFDSLKRWSVGLGVEAERIIIERLSYFFVPGVVLHLGEVAALEVNYAEDLVYNTVKTGYRNNTYDSVNGKDEFNVTQAFSLPIKRVTKELSLISPVRADMTGMEIERNRATEATTDRGSDNDPFMVDCILGGTYDYFIGTFRVESGGVFVLPGTLDSLNGMTFELSGTGAIDDTYTVSGTTYPTAGFTNLAASPTATPGTYTGTIRVATTDLYLLNRPAYSPLLNLLQPEKAYNIELSPKRGLLNNGGYLRSICEDDGSWIKFTSGEKNSELVAGTVTEKANVNVGTLDDRFFRPYYMEFDCEVPSNFIDIMNASPYGEISFDYKGRRYYGYLWDGGVKPATNDKAKFKLLMSIRTDKQNLNWA